ncbi:MAG: ATP-binding protein [Nitrospirae bacterium]|nr:ATP-binding protein [Nitrospirota bacterium]
MYIQRDLAKTFKEALRAFPSVIITGPRQSGKTTFVQNELKTADYVSFDDPTERDFARHDPKGFLKRFKKKKVVIDEIQYVAEIIHYIKLDIEQARHRYGRWVLTGSQQFILMKEISESLAGRVGVLELLPFCTKEALSARKINLEQILWYGLYPEITLKPAKRDLWVRSYVRTYLERDVRQLMNIKDLRVFEEFVSLLAAQHAQVFNHSALARDVGVSVPTIKSWVGVLEASYIIYFLRPYFKNYGKRIIKSPKMYFLDPALVSLLTRQPSMEAAVAGAMGGALFEGFIVSEAVKAYLNSGKSPDIFYWRSHDGLEVDLILQTKGKLLPVEIKLSSTPATGHVNTLERFKKTAGKDAFQQGIVVCRVDKKTPLPHDNLALPWWEFYGFVKRLI